MEFGGVYGRWLAGLVMLEATADPVATVALGMALRAAKAQASSRPHQTTLRSKGLAFSQSPNADRKSVV